MFILNKEVYQIIELTKKFGICAPINSRGSVKNDSLQGINVLPAIDDASR